MRVSVNFKSENKDAKPKYINIIVGRRKAKAILLERKSPTVCSLIWDALPLEGELHYAKIAGKEVFFIVPIILNPPIERMNSTAALKVGSVVYYPNRQFICIFYEATVEDVNVVPIAEIVENLNILKKEMDKVKFKQGVKVLFKRANN